MKKFVLFVSGLAILALASCRTHKTCPTYLKNTSNGTEVNA
ncbi:MAG: hypothetical protein U0V72_09980 [Cytophagales bacterium]